jgi:hypothetical protein
MSHAPGTWGVRNGTLSIYTNYGGSTYHKVADARQPLFTRECQDANARLIAAAPKMLWTLEQVDAYLSPMDGEEDVYAEIRGVIHDAIAQAKGE